MQEDTSTVTGALYGEPAASGAAHHLPGRSLLPVSRVQRIVKADKELPIIAREAVFAISIATEAFIKRLSEASQKQAAREKRSTVQKKDILSVVKRAEEFVFLEDLIGKDSDETTIMSKARAGAGQSG